MKMSLKEYEFIKMYRFFSLSKITKDIAQAAGYNTAKAAKDVVKAYKDKRDARDEYRNWIRKQSEYPKSVRNYAKNKSKKLLTAAGVFPKHCEINSTYGGSDVSVMIDRHNDWNGYAKSYGYPMTVYDVSVNIPRGGVAIEQYDGISMIVKRRQQIGRIRRIDGIMLSHGRKTEDIRMDKCTVLTDGTISAHGSTSKDAMKAYERKVRALKRKATKFGEVISARDYMRITGACEMGTRAFCDAHGLDFDTARMTVAEALKATKGSYGHNRLYAAVRR